MKKTYQCPICPETFSYISKKQLEWNIKAHEMGNRHNLYLRMKLRESNPEEK